MLKPTLLILAAGMASRYGSMKQVDGFGPNGETIIDYSIYDAIRAGFGKIVFVIREEFEESFKSIFEPKLNGLVETEYVFQDFDLKKYGIDYEVERAKPWGTAHAMMAAKQVIKEPFCVINADDFYGVQSYKKMYEFLTQSVSKNHYSLMGYEIYNTLSDYGSVSRGVCEVDEKGMLTSVVERTKVYFENVNSEVKGPKKIVFQEGDETHVLSQDKKVSMNFWGFDPEVFKECEILFKQFVEDNKGNPKAEFFIPLIADHLIQNNLASFKVIPTEEKWFGVTYVEDKPIVESSLKALVDRGDYPEKLF